MKNSTAVDLSERHQLVGELFTIPSTEQEWEPFRLTEAQVEFYGENGYLHGIPLLNAEQIEALRADLDSFFQADHAGHELWYEYHNNESADADQVLFHALGAWRIKPNFHDALWNPAFTMAASQLLEGAVRFWHDQLFCKPARHGGVVAWHQDYSYWTRTAPMAHLTCWIGLDDSNTDNGGLHYIPGSHQWDLLPMTELAGEMDGIRQVLSDRQWRQFQNPIAIDLKAGECSFHHPLMVHGSFANRTERPRRALVINVARDGVESIADEPLLAGTPALGKGNPLGGQFHPMLFDPNSLH
jgi:ectoine hydroxylase-related dioxygenase (phytanoyl-CoA dioxygenase family)